MKTVKRLLAGVIACSVLTISTLDARSQVVEEIIYSNVRTPLGTVYSPANSALEFGDEINFAGQNTFVNRIQFDYNTSLAPSAAKFGVLRVYSNDGPNDGVANAPQTLLYQSPQFVLQDGFHQVDITGIGAGLGFLVPSTVTWTVAFSGLQAGESAALLLYDPPTVGSGPDDFWQKDGLGAWTRLALVPLPANFGAQFTAVPEPSVIQLAVLGGIALGGYAMRRRKA